MARPRNVIDAETGQPVVPDIDRYRRKALEDHVAKIAYPAVLPAAQRRLLAVKLYQLEVQQTKAENEARIPEQKQRTIEWKKVSAAAKRKVRAIFRAQKTIDAASEWLRAQRVSVPYGGREKVGYLIYQPTDDEIAKAKAETLAKQDRIKAENQKLYADFVALIRKMADAHIEKERKKLPAELVKELDAIGTPKALPPHTEE